MFLFLKVNVIELRRYLRRRSKRDFEVGMKYVMREGIIILTDNEYDSNTKYDVISNKDGDVLLMFYDQNGKKLKQDYYQFGQFVISTDDIIYEQVLNGCNCFAFIKKILKLDHIDENVMNHLLNSIIFFNIYTFDISFIDREKFMKLYGKFKVMEFLGKQVPSLITIRIDDKVIHIPDNYCRVIYNVRNEIFTLLPNESWSEINDNFEITNAFLRKPYSKPKN